MIGEIDRSKIVSATMRLLSWLKTWETREGAYNGYIVHRHDSKRMFKIHDTCWAQAPIINGYINLYEKTGNDEWRTEAIRAADLQVARVRKDGKYMHAGHEDERFTALVSCAMANCALLDLAMLLKEENDASIDKYIDCVLTNTNDYLIKELWVEGKGVFKVSEIDYYSPLKDRYIANMNSVAIENLVKIEILTQKDYSAYIERVAQWLLTQQIRSRDRILNGAIMYSSNRPNQIVNIYTALALRGANAIYNRNGDDRFKEMMLSAAKNMLNLIDPNTNLFYHGVYNGRIKRYPQFVAGEGIILRAINDTETATNNKFDYEHVILALLGHQLDIGGFQNFYGYRTKSQKRYSCWEDIVPTIGWNAHLFGFLTRMVPQGVNISRDCLKNKQKVGSASYFYYESSQTVAIFSGFPFMSFVIYITRKKSKFSTFYFNPWGIMRSILNYSLILPTKLINKIKQRLT